MIIVAPSFSKISIFKCFRPYENEKPAFSNSSSVKSVFEKLRFRDGLVWTVGLTVEIKQRFQISPEYLWRLPKCHKFIIYNINVLILENSS